MAVQPLASHELRKSRPRLDAAFSAGVRATVPVLAALGPMGIALGATFSNLAIPPLTAWLTTPLIYGASAQLAAATMLGAGSGAAAVILTVAIINARSLFYSAALRQDFREQPRWFRLAGPYLLVDPLFGMMTSRPAEFQAARETRNFYLGAGIAVWISWHLFIAAGILLGPVIPRGLDLQFTAVALLIAMLVPGLRCRSARAAAAAGALMAAVTYGLPGGTGLLVAALAAATLTSLFDWKRC